LPLRPRRPASRRPVRWMDAFVAVAAAIAALGVLTIAPHTARIVRAPLAVVPLAPGTLAQPSRPPAGPVAPVYRVRAGDTLWSIAARALGDPYRWQTLWRVNAGRLMSDGMRFVDPDLIRPGWRLLLSSPRGR